MRKYRSLLIVGLFMLNVAVLSNLIRPAAAQEAWEGQDLTWYYDNLTDTDRKKIRQAFDYCIPREQIIQGLMQGYAIPLATEIGTNIFGYDPSVQPREYNTTKALELLTEVFGKKYDVDAATTADTTDTDVPYFSMTLISPTTNVARTQWASMISFALTNVGIDVQLKWWNWNVIMPRLFLDPAEPTGANYREGGFDAYFIGFGASADPDYSGQYYNESFAPAGDNSMYVERADFQDIIKRSLEDPIEANRFAALQEYQAWFKEWVPKSIIRQALDTFPQDAQMEGFDTYNYGRFPWVHNLSHPTETTLTSYVPGDFVDFNPLVSNSWYDSVPATNAFLSLSARRGIYNLSAYPMLAESWNSSADGMDWTIKIKDGVYFDDGHMVDAYDVVESYRVAMNSSVSTYSGDLAVWFASSDDIYATDNETIQMELQVFYPYVTTATFGVPVMKMEQLREIGMENLKTDTTNQEGVGLIGNGPFMFDSFDVSTGLTMVKNTYYDGVNLGHDAADGIFLDYAANGFDTYICTVVKDATAAYTAITGGTTDLLDPNAGIFGYIEDLVDDADVNVVVAPEYGWQELAYNHYDPRWGLNPHDPREMYPDNYATSTTTEETTTTTTTTTSEEVVETTTPTPGFELIMVLLAAGIYVAARP